MEQKNKSQLEIIVVRKGKRKKAHTSLLPDLPLSI
jgi:hypothetical protein